LEPGRPLSTGLGPVSEPHFGLDLARVEDRPRPLELSRRAQTGEQQLVQAPPHPRPLPLVQTPPTGDPGAEAELLGQVRPGDPRMQHEQDPLQRLAVGQPLSARLAEAPSFLGSKRLDQLPQLVRHDPRCNCHRHLSQLDDGCRWPSSSASGRALQSEISSKPSPLPTSRSFIPRQRDGRDLGRDLSSQNSSTGAGSPPSSRPSTKSPLDLLLQRRETARSTRLTAACRVRGVEYQERQHPNRGRHRAEPPTDPGWITLLVPTTVNRNVAATACC
jgi:hypothetical protein